MGHAFEAGFLADCASVVIVGLAEGDGLGAVPDVQTQVSKQLALGSQLGVVQVVGIGQSQGVAGFAENRNEDCVQNQAHNDDGCDHGGFVLAETIEGITEEADLLGLKLLVMELAVHAHKLKLLGCDIRNVILISHFLDPILILGSMKP